MDRRGGDGERGYRYIQYIRKLRRRRLGRYAAVSPKVVNTHEIAAVVSALGEPHRLELLVLLDVGMTKVSHHLKAGRRVYYSATTPCPRLPITSLRW